VRSGGLSVTIRIGVVDRAAHSRARGCSPPDAPPLDAKRAGRDCVR
jgi:hypothetical protein